MTCIRLDLLSQGRALAFGFRQTIVLHTMAIALEPLGADLASEPIGGQARYLIQRGAQSFAYTLQVGKRAHAREHMGGIAALFAPGFEPPALLASLQQHLQQQRLGLPSHQTLAKLAIRTEASKPGSESSKPRAYFQSIRPRTASAACRSVSPSTYCSTKTMAKRHGAAAGCPREENNEPNCSS